MCVAGGLQTFFLMHSRQDAELGIKKKFGMLCIKQSYKKKSGSKRKTAMTLISSLQERKPPQMLGEEKAKTSGAGMKWIKMHSMFLYQSQGSPEEFQPSIRPCDIHKAPYIARGHFSAKGKQSGGCVCKWELRFPLTVMGRKVRKVTSQWRLTLQAPLVPNVLSLLILACIENSLPCIRHCRKISAS